jgi:hypothetical protein
MRRKNVLEALLLQAIARDSPQLLLMLDADSAQERPYAETVKFFAREWNFPLVIGFGQKLREKGFTMQKLLHSAQTVIATSLWETSGSPFLDAPMAGKPFIGRDIPEVTRDLTVVGFPTGTLYDRFLVPLPPGEKQRLHDSGVAFARRVRDVLNIPSPWVDTFVEELNTALSVNEVDFGLLDITAQARILTQLKDPSFCRTLRKINPMASFSIVLSHEFPQQVLAHFGMESYAQRFRQCVEALFQTPDISWEYDKIGPQVFHLFFTLKYQRPILGDW